ncbi:hypothetical protein TUM4444_07990 [Shewanella sp. MBTL60-112-B1]|nr:hypothetical protein TUM4444_07990 [Shewanella sp. MBTL60-112-B1]
MKFDQEFLWPSCVEKIRKQMRTGNDDPMCHFKHKLTPCLFYITIHVAVIVIHLIEKETSKYSHKHNARVTS